MFGPFDRIADTDNPFFSKKRVIEILIGVRVDLKLISLAGLTHIINELAAEDQIIINPIDEKEYSLDELWKVSRKITFTASLIPEHR